MGWGGSALAMIQSLKNNKDLLPKRNRYSYFDAKKKYLKVTHDFKLNYNSATKEELEQVRIKIRKQKKAATKRVYILLSIILPIIIYSTYLLITFMNKEVINHQEIVKKAISDKYHFYIKDGDYMISIGKWDNAILQYSMAQQIYPKEFSPQYRKALVYSYKCQYTNEDCSIGDSLVNRLYKYFPYDRDVQRLYLIYQAEAKSLK